jgi:hypothetical protein
MHAEFKKSYIHLKLCHKMSCWIKIVFNTVLAGKLWGFFTHFSMVANSSLFTNYPNLLNLDL